MTANFNPDASTTLTEADILDPAYVPSNTPVTGRTAKASLLSSIFMIPSPTVPRTRSTCRSSSATSAPRSSRAPGRFACVIRIDHPLSL
jgi:hypothetical protein